MIALPILLSALVQMATAQYVITCNNGNEVQEDWMCHWIEHLDQFSCDTGGIVLNIGNGNINRADWKCDGFDGTVARSRDGSGSGSGSEEDGSASGSGSASGEDGSGSDVDSEDDFGSGQDGVGDVSEDVSGSGQNGDEDGSDDGSGTGEDDDVRDGSDGVCVNGNLVSADLRCDDSDDCGDGTDEVGCDYCKLEDHTMCKFLGPSDSCNEMTIFRELSQIGKDAILDKHNELRRRVAKGEQAGQPPAANMRKLVWNEELEKISQRWADQCIFGHDPVRSKLNGTSVGQNAYWGGNTAEGSEADIKNAVANPTQAWFNEVTNPGFASENINPFVFNANGLQNGHYSQVVWAKTEELGCGVVYYKGEVYYETIIVCNYAQSGNYVGAVMYEEGDACDDTSQAGCEDGLWARTAPSPDVP